MTEKKTRKLAYIAGNNPFADRGNDGFLISNIDLGYSNTPCTVGDEEFDGSKHEVYMPLPKVADHETIESLSDECKAFYGPDCDLQAMLASAVTQFFTRPNYKASIKDQPDEASKHAAAIDLAANYQVGRKASAGPTIKAKAAKLGAMEKEAAELGLSMDEILALAKQMKESGQI